MPRDDSKQTGRTPLEAARSGALNLGGGGPGALSPSKGERPPSSVLSGWSALVDRTALHVMERLWLTGGDPSSEEARERQRRALERYASEALLKDPLSFFPEPRAARVEVSSPAPLPAGRIERYRWRSGYRTHDAAYQAEYDSFEENRFGHAEALRHERPGAPTVVCLHTWATGHFALQRRVFAARRLYEAGLDVVLAILPFHGPRAPRGALFGGQHFPGTCPQRTNEAFGQAVWDVRSLVRWLRATGSGPTGVMGMSLGGYTSAILASVEDALAFSIPMIPMVSIADLLWQHGERSPHRAKAEERGATLERVRELYAVHSPLRLRPLLPRERLMIVAGRGDRVTDPAHVEKLWEHWNRPRIHWFPGSHIVHFGHARIWDEVLGFLDETFPGRLSRGREDRPYQLLRRNVGPLSIFFPSLDARKEAKPDVILLQGFGCASGAMERIARHLDTEKLASVVPPLGGLFGCLQTAGVAAAGERLARYLETLPEGTRPWLVAHSLGGLVARWAVQRASARVAGVITIASPHRGSPWAAVALLAGLGWVSRAPFDMLPWSGLLRGLNGEPWPEGVPLVSIVSKADPLCIHPLGLAPFAENGTVRSVVFEGLGHTELLRHSEVLELVAALVRAK